MFDPFKTKAKVALYCSVAFLFGIGIASGLGWTGSSLAMPTVDSEPQISEAAVRPALDLSDAFVNIAEHVTPGVVRIEVQRPRRAAQRIPEQFRRFFDAPDGQQDLPPATAGGSGFLVSEDGYILTNDHVVSDAEQITVWLNDGRYFPAEMVGTDQFTDVAVIRVDPGDEALPHLSLGSSDDVRVGEWILAVGNPGFGGGSQLEYTVTAGIVSAVGRPLGLIQRELQQEVGTTLAGYSIEDFIQTDAVINPGNSGGPMVDLRGQVVGINSAIASATGFYQGYGFAIPINLASRVMEDLVEYGQVRRAWLGVSMRTVDSDAAEAYALPSVAGALVQDFPDGSPAADAGLQREDVIIGIDGRDVARSGQLQQLIAMKRPGDRVTVDVWRNGQERHIDVTLGEAPLEVAPTRVVERDVEAEESLGIRVSDLTPELADRWQYSDAGGAVIVDVQRGGPAFRRGVVPGFKILEVNRVPVSSAEDVKEALDRVEAGEVVTLLLADPSGATSIFHVRAIQ